MIIIIMMTIIIIIIIIIIISLLPIPFSGPVTHSRNQDLRNHCGFSVAFTFQWYFPKDCHFSVVFSKGLSLVQWISTGKFQWTFSGIFQRIFISAISGV